MTKYRQSSSGPNRFRNPMLYPFRETRAQTERTQGRVAHTIGVAHSIAFCAIGWGSDAADDSPNLFFFQGQESPRPA